MENKKFSIRVRGIIVDQGKLFLVKHSESSNFYALPGGHLEWGEDIKGALEREILEELGVKPTIGRLLYINNFMDVNNAQSIEFFFEILNSKEYLKTDHLEKTHGDEILESCWVEPGSDINIMPTQIKEYFNKGEIISNEVRYIK